jgi:hypothetical protein
MPKQEQAILVLELKGFAAQATELAKRVEEVGITPERIRSAAQTHIANAIAAAEFDAPSKALQKLLIGGDTWYFTFSDVSDAAIFAARLAGAILDLAVGSGLFYLKPCLALSRGMPRLRGDRFLDDASIAAYRAADKGEPFRVIVMPPAATALAPALKKNLKSADGTDDAILILDWRPIYSSQGEPVASAAVHMSSLLTDTDVAHFASNREVLRQLMIQQQSSATIRVFGGAIALEEEDYLAYAKAAVRLVRSNAVECVVQNYFSQDPSPSNYAWLRTCARLSREHPNTFSYSAYILQDNAVRPIAYHLYDDTAILFLRRYNEARDIVSMGGSILIRNERLSQQLREHFVEGVKTIKRFKPAQFSALERQLSFSRESIDTGEDLVKALFEA